MEDEDAVLRLESSERNEEHILMFLQTCGCEPDIMGIFERGYHLYSTNTLNSAPEAKSSPFCELKAVKRI